MGEWPLTVRWKGPKNKKNKKKNAGLQIGWMKFVFYKKKKNNRILFFLLVSFVIFSPYISIYS